MGRVLETSWGDGSGWARANLAEHERYHQRVSQMSSVLKLATVLWRLRFVLGLAARVAINDVGESHNTDLSSEETLVMHSERIGTKYKGMALQ